jgi:hypothetical protein
VPCSASRFNRIVLNHAVTNQDRHIALTMRLLNLFASIELSYTALRLGRSFDHDCGKLASYGHSVL